ncbi:hypothetical protein OS493_034892 [Desmophyllum pertusum]|uniref:Uncharacterized protein n=1 Tax=Desmophyllum pertusum TaxID=174260 RepID=A0A9X0D0N1_9CNID|nr:hypothetical protein OS493_034892 [Desmophyllum pertusum]
MKMETVSSILSVSLLVGTMLDHKENLSTDALLRTANVLRKMVVDTSESLKTSEVKHNFSLALLVENLIFSIGKAMKISSENAYFTNQNTTPTVNMNTNITNMLLSLMDQIIQGLRQSLKDDSPGNFTVTSKYLSITVVSLHGNSVDHFKLDADRSSFIMPSLNQILRKAKNDNDIVFLEMWSTPFNPFTWAKTSQRVTSHVAGLEVRDGKENLIFMSGLSPGVTILLPLNKETPVHTMYKAVGKRGTRIHHNISVQFGQSIVNISIIPQGNDISVSRVKVIQPNEIATKERRLACTHRQGKWLHRGSIACKGKTHITVTFLALYPGNYFLDIVFSGQKHNIESVEDNEEKELCIEIKKPPLKKKSENVNYSFGMSESACLFLDAKELNWKTTGCQVPFS